MSDIEFYELNVRNLGVDFYEFQERLAIFLENDEQSEDFHDNAKLVIFTNLQKEQLLRLTKKLL